MLENKNIRYKTDTMGFLVITINIPDKIDKDVIIYKNITWKPFKILNVSNKKCIKILLSFSFLLLCIDRNSTFKPVNMTFRSFLLKLLYDAINVII